jgi:hypothetical protein
VASLLATATLPASSCASMVQFGPGACRLGPCTPVDRWWPAARAARKSPTRRRPVAGASRSSGPAPGWWCRLCWPARRRYPIHGSAGWPIGISRAGAQVRHEGHFSAGGVDKDATFGDVVDHDINDELDAAYREKYRHAQTRAAFLKGDTSTSILSRALVSGLQRASRLLSRPSERRSAL